MMLVKKKLFPILLTLLITMLILLLNKPESVPLIVNNNINDNKFLVWNYSVEANLNGQWRQLTEEQVSSL